MWNSNLTDRKKSTIETFYDFREKGASQGDPGKVVGGFLLVALCLGAAAMCTYLQNRLVEWVGGRIAAALGVGGGSRTPVAAEQPSTAEADIPLVVVVSARAGGGEEPEMALTGRPGSSKTHL